MADKYVTLEAQAQPGAFSQYDMQVLDAAVQTFAANACYVEIGVDQGRSLSVVKLLRDDLRMYGVDIIKPEKLTAYLDNHPEITFFWGDSVAMAEEWPADQRIDLLFIDGDHSYTGCQRDIAAWYPYMAPQGVLLFHDYDKSSPGVIQAVDEFAKERGVAVLTFEREKTSMARIQL